MQAARWFANLRGRRPPPADALALLPGPEPEHERDGEERWPDQPAPGHRADRQAGRGAVLAHRPAERDGRARGRRHGQPALGASRSRQCGAIAPRWRASGAWPTCRPGRARPRSRCSRPPPRARSRRSGSPARTRRSRCPTRRPCAAPSSAASSWWCRKPSPPPPPAPSPTCCCRRRPGARRTAPSPTASGASAGSGRPSPRPARRATTGRSPATFARRLEARLGPRRPRRRRVAVRLRRIRARSGTSIASRPAAATSTSPA